MLDAMATVSSTSISPASLNSSSRPGMHSRTSACSTAPLRLTPKSSKITLNLRLNELSTQVPVPAPFSPTSFSPRTPTSLFSKLTAESSIAENSSNCTFGPLSIEGGLKILLPPTPTDVPIIPPPPTPPLSRKAKGPMNSSNSLTTSAHGANRSNGTNEIDAMDDVPIVTPLAPISSLSPPTSNFKTYLKRTKSSVRLSSTLKSKLSSLLLMPKKGKVAEAVQLPPQFSQKTENDPNSGMSDDTKQPIQEILAPFPLVSTQHYVPLVSRRMSKSEPSLPTRSDSLTAATFLLQYDDDANSSIASCDSSSEATSRASLEEPTTHQALTEPRQVKTSKIMSHKRSFSSPLPRSFVISSMATPSSSPSARASTSAAEPKSTTPLQVPAISEPSPVSHTSEQSETTDESSNLLAGDKRYRRVESGRSLSSLLNSLHELTMDTNSGSLSASSDHDAEDENKSEGDDDTSAEDDPYGRNGTEDRDLEDRCLTDEESLPEPELEEPTAFAQDEPAPPSKVTLSTSPRYSTISLDSTTVSIAESNESFETNPYLRHKASSVLLPPEPAKHHPSHSIDAELPASPSPSSGVTPTHSKSNSSATMVSLPPSPFVENKASVYFGPLSGTPQLLGTFNRDFKPQEPAPLGNGLTSFFNEGYSEVPGRKGDMIRIMAHLTCRWFLVCPVTKTEDYANASIAAVGSPQSPHCGLIPCSVLTVSHATTGQVYNIGAVTRMMACDAIPSLSEWRRRVESEILSKPNLSYAMDRSICVNQTATESHENDGQEQNTNESPQCSDSPQDDAQVIISILPTIDESERDMSTPLVSTPPRPKNRVSRRSTDSSCRVVINLPPRDRSLPLPSARALRSPIVDQHSPREKGSQQWDRDKVAVDVKQHVAQRLRWDKAQKAWRLVECAEEAPITKRKELESRRLPVPATPLNLPLSWQTPQATPVLPQGRLEWALVDSGILQSDPITPKAASTTAVAATAGSDILFRLCISWRITTGSNHFQHPFGVRDELKVFVLNRTGKEFYEFYSGLLEQFPLEPRRHQWARDDELSPRAMGCIEYMEPPNYEFTQAQTHGATTLNLDGSQWEIEEEYERTERERMEAQQVEREHIRRHTETLEAWVQGLIKLKHTPMANVLESQYVREWMAPRRETEDCERSVDSWRKDGIGEPGPEEGIARALEKIW